MITKAYASILVIMLLTIGLIVPASYVLTTDESFLFHENNHLNTIDDVLQTDSSVGTNEEDGTASNKQDSANNHDTCQSSNKQTSTQKQEEADDEKTPENSWRAQMNAIELQEDFHYCDLNGDDVIDADDLYILIAFWGPFCDCDPNSPDVNDDDVVNVNDLLMGLAEWGPCNGECPCDLNCDETVNICDIKIICAFWGAEGDVYLVNSPDLNGDCVVNVVDLLTLLAEWGSMNPDYDDEIDLDEIFAMLDDWGDTPDSKYELTNDGIVNHEDMLTFYDE